MFCLGDNHFNTPGMDANSADCPGAHPCKLQLECGAFLSPMFTAASHPASFGIFCWLSNQAELVQRVYVKPHPAYVDCTVLPGARWLSVPLARPVVATIITGENVNLRGGRGKRQTEWKRSYTLWELIMQRESGVWR